MNDILKFEEDMNAITERGYSCASGVRKRASAIRLAVAAEDFAFAEELSCEIEALQRAEHERDTPTNPDYIDPRADYQVWKLTAERFAEYVIGAYRCGRVVRTPIGTGRDHALAEFQRIFRPKVASQHIARDDFFRAEGEAQ